MTDAPSSASPAARIRGVPWTTGKIMLPIMAGTVLLSGLRAGSYSLEHLQSGAPPIFLTLLMAWLGGAVVGPLLLPWLPGESLPFKGVMAGLLALVAWPAACLPLHLVPLDVTMAVLIIPAGSALLTSRFACPGTNRDDGRKSLPLLISPLALAAGIWIMARFI